MVVDVSLVCIGILGFLLWFLSNKVSYARMQLAKNKTEENERTLFNAIRAHSNTSENVPMIAVLFFIIRSITPKLNIYLQVVMILVTISRFLLAYGLTLNATKPSTPRFIGAVITILGGTLLSIYVIAAGFDVLPQALH
jgi:uncharacterized protein